MAKADLRKADGSAARAEAGRVIGLTQKLTGLSLKEFAAALGRDERQVARWIEGTERPQLDAILAAEQVRTPFVVACAKSTPQIEVETVIRTKVS